MKASELRIGNWVFDKAHCRKQLREVYADCSVYDPIPLTEEWLIRFGFKEENSAYLQGWYKNINPKGNRFLSWAWSDEMQIEDKMGDILLSMDIKYVHQLQNLYYALTGEELTI